MIAALINKKAHQLVGQCEENHFIAAEADIDDSIKRVCLLQIM